jgi:hypothetical protein
MHPEVTGVAGSECPECGMELTEKVAQTTAADNESTPVTVANEESSAIINWKCGAKRLSQPMQLFRITSISKNAQRKMIQYSAAAKIC